MLRITPKELNGGITLQLEGQIVGPWVNELSRACETANHRLVELDLQGVTFADEQAVALLSLLRERRIHVNHCSAFLEEQLK
jgi:ABC-type transporter Mla MlaB component